MPAHQPLISPPPKKRKGKKRKTPPPPEGEKDHVTGRKRCFAVALVDVLARAGTPLWRIAKLDRHVKKM